MVIIYLFLKTILIVTKSKKKGTQHFYFVHIIPYHIFGFPGYLPLYTRGVHIIDRLRNFQSISIKGGESKSDRWLVPIQWNERSTPSALSNDQEPRHRSSPSLITSYVSLMMRGGAIPSFPHCAAQSFATFWMTFKVARYSESAIGFPSISLWACVPPNPEINCVSVLRLISSLSSSESKLSWKCVMMMFPLYKFCVFNCQCRFRLFI